MENGKLTILRVSLSPLVNVSNKLEIMTWNLHQPLGRHYLWHYVDCGMVLLGTLCYGAFGMGWD